ncbi:MAG TPA: hypothetical protein VFB60_09350 [Ktedonobacteraceae bacterium]|nr:hypothetical protein [Ktedonobacteraceae bacterium]
MDERGSEVARLREQITAEIEAMHRGFKSFAVGVARHEFIRARMERIGGHQDLLAEHLGPEDAATFVCELYITATNPTTKNDRH